MGFSWLTVGWFVHRVQYRRRCSRDKERFLGLQPCSSLLGGRFDFSFTVLVALPLFALYSPLSLLSKCTVPFIFKKNFFEVPGGHFFHREAPRAAEIVAEELEKILLQA